MINKGWLIIIGSIAIIFLLLVFWMLWYQSAPLPTVIQVPPTATSTEIPMETPLGAGAPSIKKVVAVTTSLLMTIVGAILLAIEVVMRDK